MIINSFNSLQNFLRQNDVFNRFGLKRIGVFGSFVRGEKYNDIDLLIEDKLYYRKRLELKKYLEESIHIPIDIVLKDFAEQIILFRAMNEIKYATEY